MHTNYELLNSTDDPGIDVLSETVSLRERLQVTSVRADTIVSKTISYVVHILIVFRYDAIANMFVSGMSLNPSGTKTVEALGVGMIKKQFPQISIGDETPRFVKDFRQRKS